jgi:hypothetical protein
MGIVTRVWAGRQRNLGCQFQPERVILSYPKFLVGITAHPTFYCTITDGAFPEDSAAGLMEANIHMYSVPKLRISAVKFLLLLCVYSTHKDNYNS